MATPTDIQESFKDFTQEMQRVLLRAQQGDQGVRQQLRELLDARPDLWRWLGDLAWHVEQGILDRANGQSLLARESIARRMEEMRAELAGPDPSLLEKLLVEQIVLCWGQGRLAELDSLQPGVGTQQRAQAERRQSGCQARFLAAIRQLAAVRKLLKPSPSPLEMLRVPVAETDDPLRERQRGLRLHGVGVEN